MERKVSPQLTEVTRATVTPTPEFGSNEIALIEVLKVRYERFREHFGREPEIDDPLFFDSKIGAPVPPDRDEARMQVIAAAVAANVDYRPILDLMGLN